MKNELSGMKAFVTVAELGSFSKAAEQLSLSQPALTKKIKKIESHLNIALFERTTRKLDWFYEVRHLSTSLGLVEAGLGVSALPCLAMPHSGNSTVVSVPLVEPVIRRTLGMIRVKNRPLSAAAERLASLLLLMWTDEAGALWRNVVDATHNT